MNKTGNNGHSISVLFFKGKMGLCELIWSKLLEPRPPSYHRMGIHGDLSVLFFKGNLGLGELIYSKQLEYRHPSYRKLWF